MIELGIKTDPIEARYSFPWLFDLMAGEGINQVQLGSFFELYSLDDSWFADLRAEAETRGLRIKSVFTAHRELGGFFVGDARMEKAARRNYERLIEVAGILGADFCGSNPGAVYRDRPKEKEAGIRRYLAHMKELAFLAKKNGLRALTMEPMSSLAEPPSTPEEIERMCGELWRWHQAHPDTTVPAFLCADISHGLVGTDGRVVHDNIELFRAGLPWTAEFHFKNTDARFERTFGFSDKERGYGIVDLEALRVLIEENRPSVPVDPLTGYLEIGGPKLGRDYTDPLLESQLRQSVRALRSVFDSAADDAVDDIVPVKSESNGKR